MSDSGRAAERSWAPWLVAVVAGVVFVAGIIVYYAPLRSARADDAVGQFSARETAAMTAAAVETANLLTYHRATYTADYNRAVNGATGALRKDIAGKKALTLATITKGKFDLTARVTHQALVGASGKNTIVVLISINGYKSTAPDVPTQQNLQVTMTKVGSRWLASNVQTPGVS
ncbi:hypothetical protein [uncultured Jatrophihabitans sp.]|uniref:hypothetical protein n=1 Tax=uncultured Jatrophihabitans sp. TaxID=1610747 RepID=UPI0035CC9633